MEALICEVGSPDQPEAESHRYPGCVPARWFARLQPGIAPATGPQRHQYRGQHGGVPADGRRAAITAFNYPILIGATKIGAAACRRTRRCCCRRRRHRWVARWRSRAPRGFPPASSTPRRWRRRGSRSDGTPDVAKVTFTGSVNVAAGDAAGRRRAAQRRARLGGKSAAIMLPGVDFTKYALSLHTRYARNAGQGCGSPTRILVERIPLRRILRHQPRGHPEDQGRRPARPPPSSARWSPAQRARSRTGGRRGRAGASIIAGGGGRTCGRAGS